jgi:uncharacterized protein (DUF1330 family)
MSAYALAHIREITMGPAVVEYLERIDATLAPFGGQFIVHGGGVEILEGTWRGDLIVIQFPDRDHARAWYRSPAYQAIVRLRTTHSDGDCILIDGVSAGHRATDILDAAADRREAAASDAGGIVQSFKAYLETFQTLDPGATRQYLHVPCIFIGDGGVRVMSSAAEAEAFLAAVMRDLQTRGYGRSEVTQLHVRAMSDCSALVSVGRVRVTTTGQEMERLGETYTLRKIGDDWKIVVAMVHDAARVVSL